MRKRIIPVNATFALILIGAAAAIAGGETIEVSPGPGAIATALKSAQEGDIIFLKDGTHEESVELPAGVTLKGSGPDRVVMIATSYAAVRTLGPNVVIEGIEFRVTPEAHRGVAADSPVRIERCRFRSIPEAVALMAAPLSDIVHCEFVDCDMAIRAIAESSPTVWGCSIRGGNIGVFSFGGAPHIRNNLLCGMKQGMLLISDSPHPIVVRNNVFSGCTETAMECRGGEMPFPCASIRNNIFHQCAAIATGPADLLKGISHNAIDACGDAPLKPDEGESIDPASRSFVSVETGLAVSPEGQVTITAADALKNTGIREAREEAGTKRPIGLADRCNRPGCNPAANAPVPPIRFLADPLIANSVSEEYQYLRMLGLRHHRQALITRDGAPIDQLQVMRDGEEAAILFDISRFFSESAYLEP